ncbi:hypothetical protein OS493_019042 [Desmophyllum pertusum]|uniref:Uncharacterized protein n=1 Tax=Desmophyllum pertusum TaxID=174260 RepID=A0A9W9Z2K4_9CNID|nr:hypothetical protein OS493_019042 [Desmophyllum pertusum]
MASFQTFSLPCCLPLQSSVSELRSVRLPQINPAEKRNMNIKKVLQDNCKVIDFHGDNKENARPKERDFTEFYAGQHTLYRVEYEVGKCFPVEKNNADGETQQWNKETLGNNIT